MDKKRWAKCFLCNGIGFTTVYCEADYNGQFKYLKEKKKTCPHCKGFGRTRL